MPKTTPNNRRWDMTNRAFCIAELKGFLDQMRNGDKVDMLNVSQDELNLMKTALDCYCNVGEVIAKIAETVGKIDKGLEATLPEILDGVKHPLGGLGGLQQAPPIQQWQSPTYTGPYATPGTTAAHTYASGTALDPYATPEQYMENPKTATEIALKRQEEAMRKGKL